MAEQGVHVAAIHSELFPEATPMETSSHFMKKYRLGPEVAETGVSPLSASSGFTDCVRDVSIHISLSACDSAGKQRENIISFLWRVSTHTCPLVPFSFSSRLSKKRTEYHFRTRQNVPEKSSITLKSELAAAISYDIFLTKLVCQGH